MARPRSRSPCRARPSTATRRSRRERASGGLQFRLRRLSQCQRTSLYLVVPVGELSRWARQPQPGRRPMRSHVGGGFLEPSRRFSSKATIALIQVSRHHRMLVILRRHGPDPGQRPPRSAGRSRSGRPSSRCRPTARNSRGARRSDARQPTAAATGGNATMATRSAAIWSAGAPPSARRIRVLTNASQDCSCPNPTVSSTGGNHRSHWAISPAR
jgi:hypothetical protein